MHMPYVRFEEPHILMSVTLLASLKPRLQTTRSLLGETSSHEKSLSLGT